MTTAKRVALVLLVPLLFLLASCGDKQMERFNDAGRGENNDEKADTMSFPDGFSNVAHKCDGPNMVYVLFKEDKAYGAIAVVPGDPRCTSEG